MALQFRRGLVGELPNPDDAAIGEPLFTTDEGKLRIKKADGSFAVIGGDASSSIDLSGIDADSLVKVNADQDGFVAAAGGDLPSHTHAIANVTGLQDALDEKAELADFPQNADGSLDLAQESTLLEYSDRLDDVEQSLNLNALTDGDVVKVSTVGGVKVFVSASMEQNVIEAVESLMFNNTGTTEGYLKFVPSLILGQPGFVSFQPAVFAAPEFIDGGGADADSN